jgi:putative transposase
MCAESTCRAISLVITLVPFWHIIGVFRGRWGLQSLWANCHYGSGDLHFITSSCYRRQPLLAGARHRDLFVQVLEQLRRRYQFVVVAYVGMPEHFHILISEPEKANPSVVIQASKLGVARRMLSARKRREQRKAAGGTLDETCAAAHLAGPLLRLQRLGQAKAGGKVRYIHRNPVRRGLVESPEQWQWSSFRAYACGEAGPARVNDETVLKMKIRERITFMSGNPRTV